MLPIDVLHQRLNTPFAHRIFTWTPVPSLTWTVFFVDIIAVLSVPPPGSIQPYEWGIDLDAPNRPTYTKAGDFDVDGTR